MIGFTHDSDQHHINMLREELILVRAKFAAFQEAAEEAVQGIAVAKILFGISDDHILMQKSAALRRLLKTNDAEEE